MTARPWPHRLARPLVPTLVVALVLGGFGPLALAAPDGRDGRDGRDRPGLADRQDNRGQDNRGRSDRGFDHRNDQRNDSRDDHRGDARHDQRRDDWRAQAPRGEGERRPTPLVIAPVVRAPEFSRGAPTARWTDGAHGHNRVYPGAGWVVHAPPPRARRVVWSGVPYWYDAGVWYGHGPRGYAVVRPPRGAVVFDLPSFRTVVVIAGLAYLYANGTYYRERGLGGYEVVDPPSGAEPVAALPPVAVADKVFVYPRQGQSTQQQANDEYDCHRWAKGQTDFDPTAVAMGQAAGGSASQRDDYERARGACLDARGYTVR